MKEKLKEDLKKPIVRECLDYVKIMVIASVIAFVFTRCIVVNAMVPSGSMSDTLQIDNRLIGFRLSYLFEEPQRFDVVVFKFPDDESKDYVKRIIGLPGDVVVIDNGRVIVNGEELDEPYIKEPMAQDGKLLTYVVPEGCYFMMGDNRNDSADSRYWLNTYVERDKIEAKVIFKYFENSHPTFKLIK